MVEDPEKIVAEKAKETFLEIKRLRKTMPQFTRTQKDDLQSKIKETQDKWWDEVKIYFTFPKRV